MEGGGFVVDEYGMADGEGYGVVAVYDYNGVSYMNAFTYTYRQPAAPSVTNVPVLVSGEPVATYNPGIDSDWSVSTVYPAGPSSSIKRVDPQ